METCREVTLRVLVVISLLLLSFPSLAQDKLCGPATAKDGDDLVIADVDIRLHGIDAFEANQTCIRTDGKTWACGEAARRKLEELVAGKEVCCRLAQKTKTRGRPVMRCMVGEIDLGKAMVAAGLAFDCPRFSRERYKADEAAAKAEKRGAWEGRFKPPWAQKGLSYCCKAEYPREFCP